MPSRMRHGFLISLMVISLIVVSFSSSYADTTNYVYDELNRLIRVEYADGTAIEYTYDQAGNRLTATIQVPDTTPPTTTASPPGGTYSSAQSVTLTCDDGTGSGCNTIYYSTDGSTPTTVYSAPINISTATVLKFFATDFATNNETVKAENYVIGGDIRIGQTTYTTIQAAYNAASSGDTIKCREMTFTENLAVNRNITVTLEGGYDSGFTTNYGTMSTLHGMITTASGGGTITVKNLTLQN